MFLEFERSQGPRARGGVSPVLHTIAQARGPHAAEQEQYNPEPDDLARIAQNKAGQDGHELNELIIY